MFNKKASMDMELWKQWPEMISVATVILGFLVAASIQNFLISYIIIVLSGFITGRLIFKKKGKQPLFPFFIIIIFFALGYVLGSIMANRILVILFFVLGASISYYFHKKRYIN